MELSRGEGREQRYQVLTTERTGLTSLSGVPQPDHLVCVARGYELTLPTQINTLKCLGASLHNRKDNTQP